MSAELVTVVISSYNHAPYIEESILSVLNQTHPGVELLVVDDGSTDDSVARISALRKEHEFDFKVQTNQGLTRTLNDAIGRAKGQFIAPFGSDDIMHPERLAVQIAYMRDHPEVGICGGNIELMAADGSLFPETEQCRDIPFRRLDFDDILLERKPCIPAPTMLIRTEALHQVGGFNPDIRLEDLYIQLKIAHAGYYVDGLNCVMACYRKHQSNSYRNIRFMLTAILAIYDEYRDNENYELARGRILNSMLVKASKRDRALAREILAMIPRSAWNRRTLRGYLRHWFAPSAD